MYIVHTLRAVAPPRPPAYTLLFCSAAPVYWGCLSALPPPALPPLGFLRVSFSLVGLLGQVNKKKKCRRLGLLTCVDKLESISLCQYTCVYKLVSLSLCH